MHRIVPLSRESLTCLSTLAGPKDFVMFRISRKGISELSVLLGAQPLQQEKARCGHQHQQRAHGHGLPVVERTLTPQEPLDGQGYGGQLRPGQ